MNDGSVHIYDAHYMYHIEGKKERYFYMICRILTVFTDNISPESRTLVLPKGFIVRLIIEHN